MKALIIFAGAGASRGVSENKYPMALDFRKRLPNSITSSNLYKQLVEYLRKAELGQGIDIEHILWELGRLSDTLSEWIDGESFSSNLLATNFVEAITQISNSGHQTFNQFKKLREITKKLQDQINEQVYEYYSQEPNAQELKTSWMPLFEAVRLASFNRIDVVTTNYDPVIESALNESSLKNISMGFRQGLFPGIDLNYWRKPELTDGMLTKLHGSVDWKLGNGGTEVDPVIRRGHPEFDGDHGKRLILYPGFKGVPTREPFIAFHDYFRRSVQIATHILFIGFAFRDDFINDLISSALPQNCKVAAVNPTPQLPSLPFLTHALHFQQGFGISENSTLLESGGLTPLSLKELATWMLSTSPRN